MTLENTKKRWLWKSLSVALMGKGHVFFRPDLHHLCKLMNAYISFDVPPMQEQVNQALVCIKQNN